MAKFTYSKQKHNFGDAFVRVIYENGTIVEPLSKNYNGLDRKSSIKSVSVISADGKPIYTLSIVNNKLIYRKRNLARGMVANADISFKNTKRCFILATEGKVAFVWDSEEIKEFKTWGNEEPYTCPNLRDDEK